MKKVLSIIFIIALISLLASCGHSHTWQDATCTTPKTCTECGETEGEPLGHTVVEWSIDKEATCSAEGEERGVCVQCNAIVKKAIPQLAHTPGEWTITRNASPSTPGLKEQTCTVCGEVINSEEFTLPPEEMEAQFKASCTAYDYATIARDPETYKYTNGKYTGEIIQVIESGNNVQLRVNITQNSYGWYSDTIFVAYTREEGESRLLEDDIVTIYGVNMGTISYESVLGATVTLPWVEAEYIDLN